ncbi:NAD(P)H-dependent glycerol-3-phosphate dehydrogenase [Entomobacter blattae]|uniref:Glycerol-3-phosphate dehydrogenase [NAD(P)+] n=1 Tax=Entomobacter blattae TaxID=2762277 RepID=A0A7H1NRU8_9PROT|nr:NAD(P)H-dependent glycerol-3-phosphate dehydrogenase [Entomobacter blattae]QNT78508.1 putative glycerol-3-phosphate dehydrogenase 2 [Entomobacter blattae]
MAPHSSTFGTVAVIGAGSWGVSLALQALRAGNRVQLWSRTPPPFMKAANNNSVKVERRMPRLPEFILPEAITVTSDFAEVQEAELYLLTMPLQALRSILPHLPHEKPYVICCKGIENPSMDLPSKIVSSIHPKALAAVLSGPNFAREIAQGLPAASVIAHHNSAFAAQIAYTLSSEFFRLYTSTDPNGVQLCGAAKNVFAIAAGILDGAKLGDNARAAMISRAINELKALTIAMEGRVETLYGLAGIGDLVLTCTGPSSRNYSLGIALGQGITPQDYLAQHTTVAEGAYTAPALQLMALQYGVDMPITQTICAVLNGGISVEDSIKALFARPLKAE